MSYVLFMALARVLETAAPAASSASRRQAVDRIRTQIMDLRVRKQRLNDQYKHHKSDPAYVRAKARLDKSIADLQTRMAQAKQNMKTVRKPRSTPHPMHRT